MHRPDGTAGISSSSSAASPSDLEDTMGAWKRTLINWRCGLSPADRARYHAPPGWNCRDIEFFFGRVAFRSGGHDGRVEEDADQLALRAFAGRPRSIPCTARMELQGYRVLLRPRRL